MSPEERQIRTLLMSDFGEYAKRNLKIRTKSGKLLPLVLNDAQRYIHERIERQRKRNGKVRAIILKGRQQGCSTYIEGRFYWLATHRRGVRAFILTHEDEATKNLYEMVQRYHKHCNLLLKPSTGASSGRELSFDRLDSGYRVGTAGNKAVGRSATIQLLHGSEVGYWPNAEEHAKGILQTIPEEPGTEVVLESTANGVGNFFHQQWRAAEGGVSGYEPIFVPWHWQKEYRIPVQGGFEPTEEEMKLRKAFKLDDAQLNWRRSKIQLLASGGGSGELAFRQEYPNSAAEAFIVSGGEDGLITMHDCIRARNKRLVETDQVLVIGVDPSRGGDRFSIIRRRGRRAYGLEMYGGTDVDTSGKQLAILKKVLDKEKPERMFVDFGYGADLVDRCHELGYSRQVRAINFGTSPFEPEKYRNKRAEMWGLMAKWMRDEHMPVEIPDSDALQADLCASPYDRDANNRIALWSKDKIRAKFGLSPDAGDALALTFAEPVRKTAARTKRIRSRVTARAA